MKNFIFLLILAITSCSEKPLPEVSELLTEANQADWSEAVKESVIIEAPISDVWTYASDSTKAHDWSVFFDHISPLPGIPDGQVGALRRCYRNADESGGFWDEVTTESIPEERRQIVTYNIRNFNFDFLARGQYALVRQTYRSLGPNQTEMSFLTRPSAKANFLGKIGFMISEADTRRIFKENLENIKAAIEKRPRPHAWY